VKKRDSSLTVKISLCDNNGHALFFKKSSGGQRKLLNIDAYSLPFSPHIYRIESIEKISSFLIGILSQNETIINNSSSIFSVKSFHVFA